tara:strand:- start:3751 stop:4890 length:1140 start_codon:yes stop_codon:yes gene_type:complete
VKTIVLVTTSYPSVNDGSEAAGSFVEDFAEELSKKVKVIILAPGQEKNDLPLYGNLQVKRYAASSLPLSLLKISRPWHWLPILRVLRSGNRSLEQIIKKERIDHIFALWVLPSGWWALKIKKKYAIPYSTWALGSDIWSLGKIPLVRSLLNRVLQESQQNFADGYQLADEVKAISARECKFLASTRKLALPTQENLLHTQPDSKRFKLAFLGRWHSNKGIDILLQAISLLDDAVWDKISELRIYGGGPLQDSVIEGVGRLERQGRQITLGGYLDKAGAARLLSWADYVLIPSRIESIPVIFSDAMKMGRPVLSTPVGDLSKLISQYECGLLAKNVSATAYAELLDKALQQDKNIFAAGVARAAEDFSLPVIAEKFYQSL